MPTDRATLVAFMAQMHTQSGQENIAARSAAPRAPVPFKPFGSLAGNTDRATLRALMDRLQGARADKSN